MTTNTKNRTKTVRGMAVALTVAATLTGSGVAAAASAPGRDAMREAARSVLAAGAPGYLARVDDGRRVRYTAAGLADTATGRPLDARDQFEIGSNTKTFTATLILQLVDQGKVTLDAPVEKYLPGVVPNGENITVRMLLQHTSGLFSYTAEPSFFAMMEADPQHVFTEQELLDIAFAHKPNFAPGAGWSYSNTNYTLLGIIAQKQTGKSLATLVQQRIAGPLGLRDTYYADPRATNTGPGYAHGYAITLTSGAPTYVDIATGPIGGWGGAAGAVVSTSGDLSRFFSAVLGGKLFSSEQLRQMKTTVEIPEDFGVAGRYGLGLIQINSECGTVWGHGGDTMGHHSSAYTTADGRRTAVSDATAGPSEKSETGPATRYVETLVAADAQLACAMLGK
jgi:D-alanyl-D-alanine carboxypeptidase